MFLICVFALGIVLGIIPCLCYGKYGGDEGFCKIHPKWKKSLHYFHHWMTGLTIIFASMLISLFVPIPIIYIFTTGFGLGMTLDDLFFHSFENYFKRKINGNNESG